MCCLVFRKFKTSSAIIPWYTLSAACSHIASSPLVHIRDSENILSSTYSKTSHFLKENASKEICKYTIQWSKRSQRKGDSHKCLVRKMTCCSQGKPNQVNVWLLRRNKKGNDNSTKVRWHVHSAQSNKYKTTNLESHSQKCSPSKLKAK